MQQNGVVKLQHFKGLKPGEKVNHKHPFFVCMKKLAYSVSCRTPVTQENIANHYATAERALAGNSGRAYARSQRFPIGKLVGLKPPGIPAVK